MLFGLALLLGIALADDPKEPSKDAPAAEEAKDGPAQTTAAGVIGALTRDQNTNRDEKVDQFMKKVVWFQDIGYFTTTGQQVGSASVAKRGKFGETLSLPEFFDAVGETDKAAVYRQRRAINAGVGLGAFAGLIAASVQGMRGLLTLADGSDCFAIEDEDAAAACELVEDEAIATKQKRLYTQAGVFGVVGVGGLVFVGAHKTHKTELHERREMAEAYNEGLLKELGLTKEDLKGYSSRYSAPRVRGQVSPYFGPGAAGARLDFEF